VWGVLRRPNSEICVLIPEVFSKMRAQTAVFPKGARNCHSGGRAGVDLTLVFPIDARTPRRFPERCANFKKRASLKFSGLHLDFFQISAIDARTPNFRAPFRVVTLADRREAAQGRPI
jgi:hypothetical protein